MRTLNTSSSVSSVARQRVDAGEVDDESGGSESVTAQTRGRSNAADDRVDLKPTVVQKLPDSPLGRHEVVRVVDVPEERAFFQIVRNNDEGDAGGSKRSPGFRDELTCRVDSDICSRTWSA